MTTMQILQSEGLSWAFYPRSIIQALYKHKLMILVQWIVYTGIAVMAVSSVTRIYHAEALILVESQKIPETFVPPTVQTTLEARLDGLKQEVLSRERLWSLIEELDLYSEQRRRMPQEEVVRLMRSDVTIKLERGWSGTRLAAFRVVYEATSPTVAADVPNRIAKFFVTENSRQREQEAAGTSQFLDGQLTEAKAKLDEQETQLRRFKTTYNGELPEQEASLLATMGHSRTELLGIQEALGRAQQNKLLLENSLTTTLDSLKRLEELAKQQASSRAQEDKTVVQASPIQAQLQHMRAELDAARARYQDKHPEVRRLEGEVSRLEVLAKNEADSRLRAGGSASIVTRTPPTQPIGVQSNASDRTIEDHIANLRAQIALSQNEIHYLEQRRERVLREIADTEAHVQRIPLREQELAAITRDYETTKAKYRSVLDKKLAADEASAMERGAHAERFVMLEEARVPEKPIRPNRRLLAAAGAAMSLALAAAIVFLWELRKNRFLGEWELPAWTVVIGRVPRIDLGS